MSRIQELSEEEATRQMQEEASALDNVGSWETDSEEDSASTVSSDEDFRPEDESFYERIAALKQIVPPAQRTAFVKASHGISSWMRSVLLLGGKASYIVTTSAMMIGGPLALSIIDEQQVIMMDKEMRMQQSANEVLAPGAESQYSRQLL